VPCLPNLPYITPDPETRKRFPMKVTSPLFSLVFTLTATLLPFGVQAQGKRLPVTYNRDIRPILSENCFVCHGPDQNKRMANLRLDEPTSALKRGAVVPGKPEKSRLITRVFAKQAALQMPPVSSHKQLTQKQKETLRQWINEGAKYEAHWAFVPLPAKVPLPTVKNRGWVKSPLDTFILAQLEASGIRPSAEASRTDWLRRVTFDLTGLPPKPTEVNAFLADKSAKAYENVVDRLLASPHYGEQMALPWLDIARYADSYGYQSDQLCPTYPYRDWVIQAFNKNLSYKQFALEQLAGDLLPNANRDQRLATAFNRIHRMTNEGGSVAEEWRMEGVADRVRTFGTAFLGLTLECARCHDHKFDPITQKDYYAFSAFFNSIDEYGMYDQTGIVPSPSLLLPTPQQEQALKQATEAEKSQTESLRATKQAQEDAFRKWLTAKPAHVEADLTGRFTFEGFEGASLKNYAPNAKDNGARNDEVPLVEGHSGKAIQLDGENNVNFPALGRFTRHTPYTLAFWMRDPRLLTVPVVVYQACSGTDAGPFGYDLMLENGTLTARMFRHWPGNAIAVRAKETVTKNTWTHVAVTYDGSSSAKGLKIYLNGRLATLELVRDKMLKGSGSHTLTFGQRFRDRGFKGGNIDDLSIYSRDISPIEVAQLYDNHSLKDALANPQANENALREYYLSAIDAPTRANAKALESTRAQAIGAEDACYEVAVMEEMQAPRPAYALFRGQYDAPKTEKNRVGRTTPASLTTYPKSASRDRLGLAQWLLSENHPLTARVAVNRFWLQFFGRGLVETTEDFGIQGRLPSHPELLDWLARDFIRKEWNIKDFVKQLVLSSTYRQASALRPDLKERDPQNRLLARGPNHRLSAESIRDLALYASGLLDEKLGGAPVSPYQPGDLWRESNTMSPAYQQSVGKDLYRRSLYTVWKRTAPMPNMIAFDAGSREVCIARRQTTSTPLQALVLWNDPQFVEASRVLAEKTLTEGGTTDAERVNYAFLTLASRAPSAQETQLLTQLLARQRTLFAKEPEQAKRLLTLGDKKPNPMLDAVELAATTILTQTILNLDATLWKR
jgi:mono/diheme cytochrome c family protein